MRLGVRVKYFLSSETGSVAVEFSLVLVPLLLFILGSIETARFFWTNNAIEEIAISTSRCMALRAPDCSIDGETVDFQMTHERVKADAALAGISLPDAAINLEEDVACSGVTGFSSVKINDKFSSILSDYLDINIQASACFPNQRR